MLKLLNIDQIREADAFTIGHEPVASIDLMERAATACFDWIIQKLKPGQKLRIFCGQGNNGGDGLVIARLLAGLGFPVEVYSVLHSDKSSEDFRKNMERLISQGTVKIYQIAEGDSLPLVDDKDIVIDALLGSGLSKPVTGLIAEVIRQINSSRALVIAIDVPSGLFCDKAADPKEGAIIQADITLTFEVPRLAFFFPENEQYIGEWTLIPIELHEEFLHKVVTKSYFIQESDIRGMLKTRTVFAHKGNYGHGLLIAGSYGKCGAAVLASRAALRAGAGLVSVHIPIRGYTIIQTAVPEAMVSIDSCETYYSETPALSAYNAIAAGPGIGQKEETAKALKLLIQNTKTPLVLDADALNILGENRTWLAFLPKGSILTPHFKEFERLTEKAGDSFERNRLQREFSVKYGVYVILKGAFSCISFPNGDCYFNPTGNPGMATGGSGDVLTGILLGLMAQAYTPAAVCLIGTYLHGLAGDIAVKDTGPESLIAGDIIQYLGQAFKQLTLDF